MTPDGVINFKKDLDESEKAVEKWMAMVATWIDDWPDRETIVKTGPFETSFDKFFYSSYVRTAFVRKYSFAMPCKEALLLIKKYSPIIEVGCGSAFWAMLLSKIGCDIIATDRNSPDDPNHFPHKFFDFNKCSAKEAIKAFPGRTVFICWPSFDGLWARDVLKAKRIIYVGEVRAACAEDGFFDRLEKNFKIIESYPIPKFWGMHDEMMVWEKL